jgi:hypothetical protein
LGFDNDAGGLVSYLHGRIRLIDLLAAGSGTLEIDMMQVGIWEAWSRGEGVCFMRSRGCEGAMS